MKRNWKKSLSLAVSVSMALAPMTAFAEDGANDAENTTVATGEVLDEAEDAVDKDVVDVETKDIVEDESKDVVKDEVIENSDLEEIAPAEQKLARETEAASPEAGEAKEVTDETSLKDALEAAKANGGTVIVPAQTTINLTSNLDIPAGVTLEIASGATINPQDKTVTVNKGTTLKIGDYVMIGTGEGNLEITEGQAEVAALGDNGGSKITLHGKAIAQTGYSVYSKDELQVASGGQLTIPKDATCTAMGKITVDDGAAVAVEGTLEIQRSKNIPDKHGNITIADGGNLTVAQDAVLDVNDYFITGTVNAEAGATVQVYEDIYADGNKTQKIVSDESMAITAGTAQIAFGTNTKITIPEDATAEIVGAFMDQNGGNTHYRLAKADELIVQGTLQVASDMATTGKTQVKDGGEIIVNEGAALAVKKMNTESDEQRLVIDENSAVTVKNGATLNVGEYYTTGTVNLDPGAELVVVDNGQDCQMIGDQSMDITKGQAQVKFASNTEITIPADTEAAIKGTFMDTGDGNDAYRLPKNDKLNVAGKLTVADGNKMEVAGTTEVTGEVVVSGKDAAVEIVELKSGAAGGTLDIKAGGVVSVTDDAKLTVQEGTNTNVTGDGKIVTDNTANVSVPDDSTIKIEEKAAEYTITFDANGGQFSDKTTIKTYSTTDGKLTAIPENPTRSGYRFNGWSQKVDTSTSFANDTTITAQWARRSSSSSSGGGGSNQYTVSAASDMEHGKVSMSPTKAAKGSKVTITVTPDQGYEIDKVKVTDANGNKIDLKDEGNGKYTFTMPGSKVEVNATFVKAAETEPEKPAEKLPIVLTINQTAVSVFGKTQISDVAPLIRGSRTMLPIRLIAENLGARVTWNQAQKMVTITKDDLTIVIYIGQSAATVNGQSVQLDAPAFIENNRTYLPIRFVSENLGAEVTWDAEKQQVSIYPAD